jgi:hypothetical protein
MRVIITGGTGAIGSRFATALVNAGHEVIILTRATANVRRMLQRGRLPDDVHGVLWDGRTGANWHEQIDDNTAIVNLAGASPGRFPWTAAYKQRILDSRLQAGQAVAHAIQQAQHKPRALLQASAVGFYGDGGDDLLTEASPNGEGFLANVCQQWERVTDDAVLARGVRRCIVRIGVVLDTHGGALPQLLLAAQFFGKQLGHGKQWLSWIHHADVVGALVFLLNNEHASGAYNVNAPHPATNGELLRHMGALLHRPPLVSVPEFALKIVFGEMADTVLVSQRALPERLQAAGYQFQFPHLEAALHDLLNRK